MTAIIGVYYLRGVLVMADTRVSFDGKKYDEHRGVRKVFVLSDKTNYAILGFSGSIDGARKVLSHIKNKTHQFTEPLVFPYFANHIHDWLEEATKYLSETERGLKFLLCACEPRDRHKSVSSDGKISLMPFYDYHFYEYTVKADGEVKLQPGHDICMIIGSGRDMKDDVIDAVNIGQHLVNPLGNDQARAQILSTLIWERFEEKGSITVGGVWEAFWFSPPNEPGYLINWPSPNGGNNIQVEDTSDGLLVRQSTTNREFLLQNINQYIPKGSTSDIGDF